MNSATILETGGGGTTIFKIVFGTLGNGKWMKMDHLKMYF